MVEANHGLTVIAGKRLSGYIHSTEQFSVLTIPNAEDIERERE
jgi:hypothetical protein